MSMVVNFGDATSFLLRKKKKSDFLFSTDFYNQKLLLKYLHVTVYRVLSHSHI